MKGRDDVDQTGKFRKAKEAGCSPGRGSKSFVHVGRGQALRQQLRLAFMHGCEIEEQLLSLDDRSLLEATPDARENDRVLVEHHDHALAQIN